MNQLYERLRKLQLQVALHVLLKKPTAEHPRRVALEIRNAFVLHKNSLRRKLNNLVNVKTLREHLPTENRREEFGEVTHMWVAYNTDRCRSTTIVSRAPLINPATEIQENRKVVIFCHLTQKTLGEFRPSFRYTDGGAAWIGWVCLRIEREASYPQPLFSGSQLWYLTSTD